MTQDELYRMIDRNRALARFGESPRRKPWEDKPVQLSLDLSSPKPQRAENPVRRETDKADAA
jgi:hypothetical protein